MAGHPAEAWVRGPSGEGRFGVTEDIILETPPSSALVYGICDELKKKGTSRTDGFTPAALEAAAIIGVSLILCRSLVANQSHANAGHHPPASALRGEYGSTSPPVEKKEEKGPAQPKARQQQQ